LKWNPALLHGKRVEPVYGPLRRFNKESDREMSPEGQCALETGKKIDKYGKFVIELRSLAYAFASDHLLLTQILSEHAKRIDTQEQRLILLENRVYKGDSSPPCE